MNRKNGMAIKRLVMILMFVLAVLSAGCGGGDRGVPAVFPASTNPTSANPSTANPKVVLGAFQELTGTPYLMAPITTLIEREGIGSYDSREAGFTRNHLFVNHLDKTSHLLLDTNVYLISVTQLLVREDAPPPAGTDQGKTDKRPMQCILYQVIKADTDGDKRLSDKDRKTIALSDISGNGYVELIEDVDRVLHQVRRDSNTLVLIYSSAGNNHISEINLQTKQVVITKELQSIEPQP